MLTAVFVRHFIVLTMSWSCFQNGVLLRTVLDTVTGDLSDTRTRYLGSRPVKLFRISMQGSEAVSTREGILFLHSLHLTASGEEILFLHNLHQIASGEGIPTSPLPSPYSFWGRNSLSLPSPHNFWGFCGLAVIFLWQFLVQLTVSGVRK